MKKSAILIGRIYTDGKSIRKIIDEGPHCKLYHTVTDPDGLQYEILHGSEAGSKNYITRTAFASWAKREIPEAAFDDEILTLVAKKLRLAKPLSDFLAEALEGAQSSAQIDCQRGDTGSIRTARALVNRGLLKEVAGGHVFETTPLAKRWYEISLNAKNRAAAAA